jgi:hypothetical protein
MFRGLGDVSFVLHGKSGFADSASVTRWSVGTVSAMC